MKTKKVTLSRATASFSTAASHISSVTMPLMPWETEDKEVDEEAKTKEKQLPREPKHIGTYKKDRKL